MSTHPLLRVDMSELGVAERIQLAEDLWDSVLNEQDKLPLTDAQKQEIDRRLENYQQDPTNAGSSWDAVKRLLILSK